VRSAGSHGGEYGDGSLLGYSTIYCHDDGGSISENSVNLCETTRRNIPESSQLYSSLDRETGRPLKRTSK
jgi:hypothetical protein